MYMASNLIKWVWLIWHSCFTHTHTLRGTPTHSEVHSHTPWYLLQCHSRIPWVSFVRIIVPISISLISKLLIIPHWWCIIIIINVIFYPTYLHPQRAGLDKGVHRHACATTQPVLTHRWAIVLRCSFVVNGLTSPLSQTRTLSLVPTAPHLGSYRPHTVEQTPIDRTSVL